MSILGEAVPMSFVCTANRGTAKPFYAGALELPILAEDAFAVTFGMGQGVSLRLTDLPDHQPSEHTVVGWAVPDIDAAVAALTGKGVAFMVYEGFGQADNGVWTAPGGGARVAWFKDPDGNVLSLTQFG